MPAGHARHMKGEYVTCVIGPKIYSRSAGTRDILRRWHGGNVCWPLRKRHLAISEKRWKAVASPARRQSVRLIGSQAIYVKRCVCRNAVTPKARPRRLKKSVGP